MIAHRIVILSLTAAAALVCCGCLSDDRYSFPDQKKEEEGGAAGEPKVFEIKEYEVFGTEVGELSSICFTENCNGFFAVGDEGDVYEIGLDGGTRAVLSREGHDWEGVERYGSDILLMEESESALYRLSGGELSKVSKIEIPGGGVSGKGPEGLACVGDTAYVGNQAEPARIVKYNLKTGKSGGYIDIKFVKKYISDLCYDSTDNTMWIVDSKGPAFYHCTLEGKLIATYKIPFVAQAEALAVDRVNNIAWVGCDSTSKLYKIKIEF